MIGLDTNVLVRYLTQDDAAQARVANAMIARTVAKSERCFVGSIVVCELVWVLEGPYEFRKSEVVEVLDRILETSQFEIEGRDGVRIALDAYRRGRGDFADYLIAQRDLEAGCSETATFDRRLRGTPAFRVLG